MRFPCLQLFPEADVIFEGNFRQRSGKERENDQSVKGVEDELYGDFPYRAVFHLRLQHFLDAGGVLSYLQLAYGIEQMGGIPLYLLNDE